MWPSEELSNARFENGGWATMMARMWNFPIKVLLRIFQSSCWSVFGMSCMSYCLNNFRGVLCVQSTRLSMLFRSSACLVTVSIALNFATATNLDVVSHTLSLLLDCAHSSCKNTIPCTQLHAESTLMGFLIVSPCLNTFDQNSSTRIRTYESALLT